MTVTWRTATGLESDGSTSVDWTLPTGHSTDDLLVAFVGQKFSSPAALNTCPTPSGYTAVISGNTTGTNRTIRLQSFHKVHDGSETAPAETAGGAPTWVGWGMMAGYSSSAGSEWTVESSTGVDDTMTGTTVSVTGGTSLTWAVGDVVMVLVESPNELSTDSSPSLSIAGGVTHGGLTQHLDPVSTTQGADGTLYAYTATIDGAGTGAPTFAATSAEDGMSSRVVIFLKITEPAGSVSLTVADSAHTHTADSPTLTQHHVLTVADAAHAHATDSPTLTQHHLLVVADSAHAHAAESPTLTQHQALTVADSAHTHTADSPTLTQHHVLTVADAAHAHAADEATLTAYDPGGVALVVDDALHAHASETPTLTQHHVLAVDDALHAHAADEPTLTAHGIPVVTLVVQDALSDQFADSPTLTQHQVLTVADAAHAVTSDNVTFVWVYRGRARAYWSARPSATATSRARPGATATSRARPSATAVSPY